MKNKVILFTAGLLLAGSGFWLYQRMTGSSIFWEETGTTVFRPDQAGKTNLEYENRRNDGELEARLTATDAKPVPGSPGVYDLINPRAEYYLNDNQVVVVQARQGQVSLRTVGARMDRLVPQGGNLSGDILLTMGPKDSFGENLDTSEAHPGQVRGALRDSVGPDGKPKAAVMSFDWTDRVLSSPDRIEVRGEGLSMGTGPTAGKLSRVTFDGKSLTLAVNMAERRLEYLRIDQGDKFTLKPGEGGFNSLGRATAGKTASATPSTTALALPPATTLAATPTTANGTMPTTQPMAAKKGVPPTIYRLQLNSDVQVNGGAFGISGEQLAAIFRLGQSENAEAAKPATPATTAAASTIVAPTASAPAVAATAPATTAVAEGSPLDTLGGAKIEEIVVTWKGPLEMRPATPADAALAKGRDAMLDVTGTEARPVLGAWNNVRVRAGRLKYHTESQVAEVEAGAIKEVQMSDPSMGLVTARQMTADIRAGHALLLGPGRVEAQQAALRNDQPATAKAPKEPLVVAFTESLTADWHSVPDLKNPAKQTLALRQVVFAGAVDAHDATFDLQAPKLDGLIAHTQDVKNPMAFERLLASGGVKIRLARPGLTLADADSPHLVTTDALQILTATPAGAKAPVVDTLIADGHVVAIMHDTDRSSEDKTNRKLVTQRLETPYLTIATEPKTERGPGTPTLGSFNAREVHAILGVKVELEGYGPQKIVATAQELIADPKGGTAKLIGTSGDVKSLALLQQGENRIAGGTILVNQKNQSIEIPGAGDFIFVQPGKKADAAAPVRVAWLTHMSFDQKSLTGQFDGSVKAVLAGKPDQKSELSSDMLKVVLTNEGENVAGAGEGKKTRLKEIIATGKVEAEGATLGPTGQVLTRQKLWAPTLTYAETTKTLTIPAAGELVVEDYRPDPKAPTTEKSPMGGGNARGMTGFHWEKSLVYAGDTGTVSFEKNVRMVHVPTVPFRSVNSKKPPSANAKPSRAELSCQSLVATLIGKDEGVSASPVAFGTSGQVHVSMVKADTAAVLEVDDQQIAGDELEFDLHTNTAIVRGRNGNLITIVSNELGQGSARWVKWDLTKDANAFETRGFTIRGGG